MGAWRVRGGVTWGRPVDSLFFIYFGSFNTGFAIFLKTSIKFHSAASYDKFLSFLSTLAPGLLPGRFNWGIGLLNNQNQ